MDTCVYYLILHLSSYRALYYFSSDFGLHPLGTSDLAVLLFLIPFPVFLKRVGRKFSFALSADCSAAVRSFIVFSMFSVLSHLIFFPDTFC